MDQYRAEFALQKIRLFSTRDARQQKEFRSYVSGLPAMIHMKGLGQAMAFCLSRNAAPYEFLYRVLSEWLCQNEHGRIYHDQGLDLMVALTQDTMSKYMSAQVEAQELLLFLKKFAVAYLDNNCNQQAGG
ncbi:MAG: type III-B CRISPR module-associated protein Cmr5 [Pseudomonadales bacterium]|nr:type III-B CRISPR module-associated protein Cmr5 [Pseudomonadales bacterium]